MGGTTVINSAICVTTPDDVFARWKRERGIDGQEAGPPSTETANRTTT